MPEATGLDPRLFTDDAISEETAQFNKNLEALLARETPLTEKEPAQARAERESGNSRTGPVVFSDMAEERTIKGPA